MACFIINEKVYDTEKMTLVGHVQKWYEFKGWLLQQMFGKGVGRMEECDLYRSTKGNYLLVYYGGNDKYIGEAITAAEAKSLLMQYDYENYIKLFGELEEA